MSIGQWIKKSTIVRTITNGILEIVSLGGNTKTQQISPKGLFSKPTRENGVTFQIIQDEGNTQTMPLQKVVNLEDGEVILTDDKNFILFKYNAGVIVIKGNIEHLGNMKRTGTLEQEGDADIVGNLSVSNNISATNFTGDGGGAMTTNQDFETTGNVEADTYSVGGQAGVSGTITSTSTVTVTNGIITNIS